MNGTNSLMYMGPVVTAVRARQSRIVVTLASGSTFEFTPDKLPYLEGMTDEELSQVRLLGGGSGVLWTARDIDISAVALIEVAHGIRTVTANVARGWQSRGPAKAARSGRPRKPEPRVKTSGRRSKQIAAG